MCRCPTSLRVNVVTLETNLAERWYLLRDGVRNRESFSSEYGLSLDLTRSWKTDMSIDREFWTVAEVII